MGQNKFAVRDLILMTGIAADILMHIRKEAFKLKGVGVLSEIIDELREVRSLAGQAVGQGVRPFGLAHVLQNICVSAGAAVILCKAIAFVDVNQIGIFFQIADGIAVISILLIRLHNGRKYAARFRCHT